MNYHARLVKLGLDTSPIVASRLINDYVSSRTSGSVSHAHQLFDQVPVKDAVLWNSIISAYAQCGHSHTALKLFSQMFHQSHPNYKPDHFVYATVARACGCSRGTYLQLGRTAHACILKSGFMPNYVIVETAFLDMYSKCRSADCARKVFDEMLLRNLVTWNVMIAAYVQNEMEIDGLELFYRMKCREFFLPDDFTVASVLTGCARTEDIHLGCVYNGLVEEARALWEKMPERNVVSWTSMISGYVKNGMPQEGLNLLAKMHANQDKPRVDGNCLTFVSGLQACSYLTDFERGKQIHAKLIRMLGNADTSNVIVGTALVDMYSKSSNLNYARTVFDRMLEKNVAAWTSIITGYAVHGLGSHALEIFHQMMGMGIQPNEVTFVSILTACSHSGLVEEGLHCFMLMRLKYNAVLQEDHYTCLIDMLGRVGRLEEAWSLVEELEDGMTYSETVFGAMLGACHLHENMELGRRVALKMLEKKMQVSTTYVTLSNVYAALGMWNEAYAVRRNFRIEVDVGRKPGLSRICM
ncbi:pentatricopeptide repeat-containing protein At1g11290, chloroplastic-like isoform X1 [Malania oleifera]|uniref:pentatricopeptide repeat-containing protein At1g11290, chloroplastic-like isoform X1 n=1 Tax=Malania oleifera TaxID=397392 RepID=UPI0025AE706B|nr:pentatricopeptide repeat-containing protein At1g11290, chloroplastic-like isoform X1 [Malania oleifera]